MIPKIIHIVWVGDKKPPLKWINTWKEKHPKWGFILWNNELVKNYNFINKKHIDVFFKEKKYHGVADLVRYEILYDIGGYAMPADSECINPLDDLEIKENFFTCYENEVHYPGRLTPVMGSTKKNNFLKEIITGLTQKERLVEPWIDSGNCYLTEVAEKTKENIQIFPSYYFMPNHRLGDNWDGKSKIYSKQYSGTTFNIYE